MTGRQNDKAYRTARSGGSFSYDLYTEGKRSSRSPSVTGVMKAVREAVSADWRFLLTESFFSRKQILQTTAVKR